MVAISPALLYTWLHPDPKRLPEVFTLTALGFFLCSFQVHEKSILLPLLPASLLLYSPDPIDRQWTIWINAISTISYLPLSPSTKIFLLDSNSSLWPLLKKDGLALQYFIFLPLWLFLSYESAPLTLTRIIHLVTRLAGTWANEIPLAGFVIGHVLEGIFSAPEKYPDIFVVWNLTVSCGCFWVYWGWLVWKLWGGSVGKYWKGKRKIQ